MTWRKFYKEPSNRFCTSCRRSKAIIGGENIVYNNGRNQRWICEECKDKRNERIKSNNK